MIIIIKYVQETGIQSIHTFQVKLFFKQYPGNLYYVPCQTVYWCSWKMERSLTDSAWQENTLWLCLSIMRHLVSWSHSGEYGRAIELVSECVSVCPGWHNFVSEYWTSLLCVLRQRRIVQWHLAIHRQEGRVSITLFLRTTRKGLQFLSLLLCVLAFLTDAPLWASKPEIKQLHSTWAMGQASAEF